MMPTVGSEAEIPARRSVLRAVSFSVAAFAILIGLGLWQLQRRAEKTVLLGAIEASALATPRVLDADELDRIRVGPAGLAAGPGLLPELTRVQLTGRFFQPVIPVHATIPSGGRGALGGPGYWWMTPLELAPGRIVLVNRGFVPTEPGRPPPVVDTPMDTVTITGLIRLPEVRGAFIPENDPARRQFFTRDPARLAAAAGLPDVAPFTVDAERQGDPSQVPVGVDAAALLVRIPNNHLQYAFTWFGLAATLVGVAIAYLASARRRSGARPD